MKLSIRMGGVLVALVLLLVACTGPATSPSPPAPTAGEPTAAPPTDAPTDAPTAPPTDAPVESPGESPATSPAASPVASPAASPGEPTPAPTPTPPPGATEGTLVIWADETRAPVFEQIGQEFAGAVGGIEVQVYQLGFGDIRDNLLVRGPAGEGPDIIIGANDWLGQLVTAGVVEPLDLSGVEGSIDPLSLEAFQYNGTQYGLPYAYEAIALYYNTDLVPTPPTTWDELKQMASDLQDDPASGVEQGYCLQQGDPYHTYPILSGMGGYIFGEDAEGNEDPQDVGLDSPGGLAYGTELDTMVKDGLLRPDIDYGACQTMMSEGRAAFWITGPWALGDFANMDINWSVAPLPTADEPMLPFVGVQGLMVSSFAPNKLLAQTFLTEYMATDDAMQALFDAGQRPPSWLPTAEAVTDENVQTFIDVGAGGVPLPKIPEMSQVWGAWTTAINLIFTQAADPEQAMRDAAETVRDAIGGAAASPSPAP